MPKVSIIIPSYGRPHSVKRLLNRLEKQTFKDFEVVVVVDGDKEAFELLSIEDEKTYPIKLKLIPNSGCNIARNKGIELAEGNFVAFTDDDCIPDNDWLENGIKYFEKSEVVGVEGLIYSERKGERAFTHNALCLRAPLLGVDISNMNAWEDYVLAQAMLDAGYKIKQVPITSVHIKEDRINEYEEAWGMPEIIKTKGRFYAFLRMFYWIWWVARTSLHFRNFWYFSYNFKIFSHQFHAFLFPKHFFESKRGDK